MGNCLRRTPCDIQIRHCLRESAQRSGKALNHWNFSGATLTSDAGLPPFIICPYRLAATQKKSIRSRILLNPPSMNPPMLTAPETSE